MKATEKYFPVVLFIVLYKVVLTFESVDEILSVTIEMKAVQRGSNFWVWAWKPSSVII